MKLKYHLLFFLIFILSKLGAQSINVSLSPKHLSKLESAKSGHQRLVRYYKYYKKDSTKHVRRQERHYKKVLDSTYRAEAKQDKLRRRLAKKGIVVPGHDANGPDTISNQLKHWYSVMNDSTASDSLKSVARARVRALAIEKAKRYPGFQHAMDKYQLGQDSVSWQEVTKQVPGLDSLSGLFDSSPEQLFSTAEKTAESMLKQAMGGVGPGASMGEIDQLRAMPDQYRKQYEQYTNTENLKTQGKDKALDEAIKYFEEQPEKLQAAQKKLSKLMSKYREFSNSSDLSDAVKATSMKGKSFYEHLVLGGNFNIISTDPFSIDLSPQIGYKFTTRFFVSVGMSYRMTFGDSIKNTWYVSPHNTSYKALINYEVIRGIYAFGEWQKTGFNQRINDNTRKVWQDDYFIGLGKKLLVHPKLYMTITAMYNLNDEVHNAVHPRRFQVRIGFQLSELAIRKRKVDYDPNR